MTQPGLPTSDEARQFALMLSCGAPPREAIRYFLPEEESGPAVSLIESTTARWMASEPVRRWILHYQGKDWADMGPGEKLKFALDKTYTEMAYFLYSRNYVELNGPDKAKADTCRTVLEAKLAGTSGQLNQVERFWSDIAAGRIKLGSGLSGPTPVPPLTTT